MIPQWDEFFLKAKAFVAVSLGIVITSERGVNGCPEFLLLEWTKAVEAYLSKMRATVDGTGMALSAGGKRLIMTT